MLSPLSGVCSLHFQESLPPTDSRECSFLLPLLQIWGCSVPSHPCGFRSERDYFLHLDVVLTVFLLALARLVDDREQGVKELDLLLLELETDVLSQEYLRHHEAAVYEEPSPLEGRRAGVEHANDKVQTVERCDEVQNLEFRRRRLSDFRKCARCKWNGRELPAWVLWEILEHYRCAISVFTYFV